MLYILTTRLVFFSEKDCRDTENMLWYLYSQKIFITFALYKSIIMTNKKAFLSLIVSIACQTAWGQTTISEIWKSMPDSIIPILNANVRNEMVEAYNSKSTGPRKNLLNGKSEVIKLYDNFMDIRLSKQSGVQLLLLTRSDSTMVVCMNKYFGLPTKESELHFFSTDWTEISDYGKSLIEEQTEMTDDSIVKETAGEGETTFPPFMRYAMLSQNGEISIYTTCKKMSSNDSAINDTTKLQKTFKWNGNSFK